MRIVFDLSGLVAWYGFFGSVTGIQRVHELLVTSDPIIDAAYVHFAVRSGKTDNLVWIDKQRTASLARDGRRADGIAYVKGVFNKNAAGWLLRQSRVRAPGVEATGAAGETGGAEIGVDDIVVNLGDFWTHRASDYYARLRRETGCRVVQVVYDILPISHPQFFEERWVPEFARQLASAARNADFLIVISQHVKRELAAYLAAFSGVKPPIVALPAGWHSSLTCIANGISESVALEKYGVKPGCYFLQVGTLEPRKNHLLVVRALHRLSARLGARMPYAVFAGRLGWKTEDLARELAAHDFLDGRIRILKDVDDAGLAALYRGARFTVYPSFVEGFGLPVRESILFGKPCLASGTSSIPEAGGDLAEYFDPHDFVGFTEKLERWSIEDSLVAERTARIRRFLTDPANVPSWGDTANRLLAEIGAA